MDRKFLRLAILLTICAFPAVLFAGGNREVVTKVILTAPVSYISPVSTVEEKKTLSITGIQLQIDKNGVIKKYEFAIYDKTGKVVFTKAAENLQGRGFFGDALNIGTIPAVTLPSGINWAAVDSTGAQVADGDYTYQLTATDNWGFTASSAPLSVVVDTKPPVIQSLSLSRAVVSPDGDGKNDNLVIKHITGPAANWVEEIKDSNGVSVFRKEYKSDSVETQMAESTAWDPTPAPVLPEGTYTYTLRGLDFAANAIEKTLSFKVSYATGDISLESDGTPIAFDPAQSVTFSTAVTAETGATTWKLEVEDSSGVIWRRFSGQGLVPSSLSFDGKGNARDPSVGSDKLRDGTYTVVASQEYESGLVIASVPLEVIIDTSKPVEPVEPVEPTEPVATPFRFYLPAVDVETASIFELGSSDENPVTFTLSGIQINEKLNWKLAVRDTNGNELWSVDSANVPQETADTTESEEDTSSASTEDFGIAQTVASPDIAVAPGAPEFEIAAVDIDTAVAETVEGETIDEISAEEAELGIAMNDSVIFDVAISTSPLRWVVAADVPGDTPIHIVWDGKDSSGAIIPGAETYEVVLSFSDENGNSLGQLTKTFISSIPVVRDGEYLKISVADVIFDGNDSNPIVNGFEQREGNRNVLNRLGTALSQLEGYKIVLAGYATYTNGFTQASMDREQRLELIPLSERRATEVKEALYLFGIDWDRFGVLARGGVDPVVPYTDTVNRYLNRRVVFLLEQ